MTPIHSKMLIIGSGPAGYTAAIYGARAMLEPNLVAGLEQGGQLMITTEVENYPGYADAVQGPWMMEQMQKQAENVGANIINDHIMEVDLDVRPFKAVGDSGQVYTGDTLERYLEIKRDKATLQAEGRYEGAAREQIARRFGRLLSYPDAVIDDLLSRDKLLEE